MMTPDSGLYFFGPCTLYIWHAFIQATYLLTLYCGNVY